MSNIKAYILSQPNGIQLFPNPQILTDGFKQMMEVLPIKIDGLPSGITLYVDENDVVTDAQREIPSLKIYWNRSQRNSGNLNAFVSEWLRYFTMSPDLKKEKGIIGTFEADILFVEFDEKNNAVKCWRAAAFSPKHTPKIEDEFDVIEFNATITQKPEDYKLMIDLLCGP